MSNIRTTLTRKQVANLLGKTVRSVLRLDQKGVLHPLRDDDGNVSYIRSEVEALLTARGLAPGVLQAAAPTTISAGALTARIFRELRAGKSLLDVTIDCELTPSVAQDALIAYARVSGAIVVAGRDLERLRAMLPRTTNASGLLQVLEQLVRDHHELRRFAFACAVCGKPVQASSATDWAYLAEQGAFTEWTHDECADGAAATE